MWNRICVIVVAVMLIPLALGGCSPATAPSETQGPDGTSPVGTTQAAATPAEQTGEPELVTFIMWQQFVDLDPAYAFASENVALNLVYENLVYMNPPGSDELLRPGLATSWEANEDATEWTFYLREGVTFQDGEPFNADAVKATFDHYWAAEGAGCSWIWSPVEQVEVVDEHTVKLHCAYPAAVDIIATSSYCGEIISSAVTDEPKEWFDEARGFGTGPYMFDSYDRGQRMILSRFDDYWQGWQDNQFDKVVFEIVEDTVQQLQMIESGEGDILREIPPDKIAQLQANPNLKVYIDPSYVHFQWLLNTQKAPTNNPLVRQALAYSYPYDELIQAGSGIYTQSRGAVPAAMWGHCEDCFQYYYDPDKARDLLEQAGYPDGLSLEVTYVAGAAGQARAAELWVYPASQIGIDLEMKGMTFSAMWEYAKQDPQTAQDITVQQWWPTYVTPYDPLFSMYHCEEETFFNLDYYCDPEFDEMIDEANVLTGVDREAAEKMFQDAQELLIEDCPAIWVMDYAETFATSAHIDGFVSNPAYPGVVFIYDLTTTR